MPGSTVTTPTNPNKHLYNGGSEWQNDYGNLPDYYQTYFRNYDAALGRWVGVDPAAESAESMSSYQYAGNNPVIFNDPLGDISEDDWNFVIQQYTNGITGNYHIDSGGVHDLCDDPFTGAGSGGYAGNGGNGGGSGGSDGGTPDISTPKTAFELGKQYLDTFNGWGKNGAANSYNAAVFAYDMAIQGTGAEVLTTQETVMLPGVTINALSQLSGAVEGSYNSYWKSRIANQGGDGVGYTLTTITSDITTPQINGPFFHSSERFFSGTVAGKEGEHQTINATKDLKGGGLDKSTKIFGLSFGTGVDSDGFNLSFGFSNSTYTLGASVEGITYGSSMLNGTNLTGHTTTFTPTPLSGFVAVGAAVFSPLVNFARYALE